MAIPKRTEHELRVKMENLIAMFDYYLRDDDAFIDFSTVDAREMKEALEMLDKW